MSHLPQMRQGPLKAPIALKASKKIVLCYHGISNSDRLVLLLGQELEAELLLSSTPSS